MLMVSIKIFHSYSFLGCLCRFSFSHSVPLRSSGVGRTAEEASARMKVMKGAVLSGLDTLEVAEKKVLRFSLGVTGMDRVQNVTLFQSRCEMNFLRIEVDWH